MSLALPIASTFLENNANVKFEPLLIVTLMPLIMSKSVVYTNATETDRLVCKSVSVLRSTFIRYFFFLLWGP